MAHTCPDCYQICYCGGDIDDIDFGDDCDEAMACTCCDGMECESNEWTEDHYYEVQS